MDELKAVAAFVRDVGFPAFIASYLLISVTPRLEKLTTSITLLVEKLEGRL